MAAPTLLEKGTKISRREHRLNREIRVPEVRLIDEQGTQLGIYPTREAYMIAQERGLDLVEIAPNARPPVCRLLDYGKFMYERSRREREARKAQRQIDVKEVRLHPKMADHDVEVKTKRAREFLADGAKVRIRVRFRGREIAYNDTAREMLNQIAEEMSDVAEVEQHPKMEGYAMLMVLAPRSD